MTSKTLCACEHAHAREAEEWRQLPANPRTPAPLPRKTFQRAQHSHLLLICPFPIPQKKNKGRWAFRTCFSVSGGVPLDGNIIRRVTELVRAREQRNVSALSKWRPNDVGTASLCHSFALYSRVEFRFSRLYVQERMWVLVGQAVRKHKLSSVASGHREAKGGRKRKKSAQPCTINQAPSALSHLHAQEAELSR